jgi:nicotinate-nucleotide adenylyltransferase
VDTLRELRAGQAPQAPLVWLMGADAFRGLADWHDWEALFGLAHFAVMVRPGHALDALPRPLAEAAQGRWCAADEGSAWRDSPSGRLIRLDMALHPASATVLRARLRDGQDTWDWLAPPVAAYIRAQGLYRGGTAAPGV